MQGTTFQRSVRGIAHMIRRPRHAARWIDHRLRPRSPVSAMVPWISWPCIDFLERCLTGEERVLEWGAGGSTIFFARAGCKVTCVETHEGWAADVTARLREQGLAERVELRLLVRDENEPEVDHARRHVASVRDGGPWDVVFVDGDESGELSRIACIEETSAAGPGVLGPQAMIVLDDAWRPEYQARVPDLLKGWRRRQFVGLGPSRPGVTQTDVYEPPTLPS